MMARKCLLSLVALLLCCVIPAVSGASDVIEYDINSFQKIGQEALVLVEFYAPWCGHCKSLAPEFELAATILHDLEYDPPIRLAKIDCDDPKNEPIMVKYGIKGFPTMKIFRFGHDEDYHGGNTAQSMVNYMKRARAQTITELADVDSAKALIADSGVAVIAFMTEREDHRWASFNITWTSMRTKFFFGATSNAAVAEHYGVTMPAVVVFKKNDDDSISQKEFKPVFVKAENEDDVDDDGWSHNRLAAFVTSASLNPFNFLHESYGNEVVISSLGISELPKLVMAFEYDNDKERLNLFKHRLTKLGRQFEGKFVFVLVHPLLKIGRDLLTFFGQPNAGHDPTKADVFIHDTVNRQTYVFNQTQADLTIPKLTQFINDFFANNLLAYVAPPKPAPPRVEPVRDGTFTHAVFENFEEVVFNPKRNKLVQFYAHWCESCKLAAPHLKELAKVFSEDSRLKKYKMEFVLIDVDTLDGRGTPHEKFQAEGIPAFFLVSRKGTVVKRIGPHEVDVMKEWIDTRLKEIHAAEKEAGGKALEEVPGDWQYSRPL